MEAVPRVEGPAAGSGTLVLQDYYSDGSDKEPRYYQATAVNAAIEAIAKGQNRLLLVMATGTGKTYTAFQIIWRLWKAGRKKRILYLADRNVLIDQTMVNDFRPFGAAMAKLSTSSKVIEREDGRDVELPIAIDKKRRIDTSYEIYLGSLPGDHRARGSPEAVQGAVPRLLRPDRRRRVPSRQRGRGFGLARHPRATSPAPRRSA